MKTLRISTNLSLPLDVATQATAILGIRGSGKTNTASVLAEELLDQNHPTVIIDPTDAWWGLRSGYPVLIFGGAHGDVPLQETDGKTLAEFQVQEQVPFILSLRHLRKGAQRRFVTEFCEELYHLKGKDQYRSPLTVFIDEAPLFVPQKVLGEVARTVGAVEDLIARGRNAGFGVVLISQRSATLNKDVLTQADTIVSHRLTSPQDRKALSDWFEENATAERLSEILASLATLKNGEAWVWAPSLDIMRRVQVRLRHTFDSSATPKPGQKASAPKALKEVDLEKLKGKLAETMKTARENDPAELRKKLAAMEKELSTRPAAKPERVEVPVIKPEQIRALDDLVGKGMNLVHALGEAVQGFTSGVDQIAAGVKKLAQPSPQVIHRPAAPPKPLPPRQLPQNPSRDSPNIGGGLRRMLIALAQRPGGMTSRQLGVRAGLSSSSGTFGTYLASGRSNGWIDGTREHLRITPAGGAALGDYEPLPTGRALLSYWLSELGGGASRMLQALAEAYPAAISKEALGQAAGMSPDSGTFGTYLSKLRTLELVTGRGELRAAEELFD